MKIYITDKKNYKSHPGENKAMWVNKGKYATDGGWIAKTYQDGYLMFDNEEKILKSQLLKENPNLEIVYL